MKPIYLDEINVTFPLAVAAMNLTNEEVEETDYLFYVHDGVLYASSHDEQMAFRLEVTNWEQVFFPLTVEDDGKVKELVEPGRIDT